MKMLLALLILTSASLASAGHFDYGNFCLEGGVCRIRIGPSSMRSPEGYPQYLVSFGNRCWTDNGWNFNNQTHVLAHGPAGLINRSRPDIGVDGGYKDFYMGSWHFYACY